MAKGQAPAPPSWPMTAGLPLLSGMLLALSLPDTSLYPLAWVGLVPYLYLLSGCPSWGATLGAHLLLGFSYFGVVLYWIPRVLVVYGQLSWWVSLPLFALLLALLSLLLLPFTLLTRWAAARSGPAVFWFVPGFWVATELLRCHYPFGGFPWALLGHSQLPLTWLVQIADVGGVILISLVVVAVNSGLAATLRAKSALPLLPVLIMLGLSSLYGYFRVEVWQPLGESRLGVSLIQPDIGLWEDREYYARRYFEDLPVYYRQAAQRGSAWVIFPEATNPFLFSEDFYFQSFWTRQVREQGSWLLLNSSFLESDEVYYNSAYLLDPQEGASFRYDKVHLVPFGEYVPWKDWLGGLARPLVQEVAAFTAGAEPRVGEVGSASFGTLICYEDIFAEISRQAVADGAGVLVNITNDGWYGLTSAPRQHLEIAAFRAIENRKPLLRAANSGYSAAIDPWGRITAELGLFREGVLDVEVITNSYRSLYSYLGEWLNMGVVLASLAGAAAARPARSGSRRSRRKKGR